MVVVNICFDRYGFLDKEWLGVVLIVFKQALRQLVFSRQY